MRPVGVLSNSPRIPLGRIFGTPERPATRRAPDPRFPVPLFHRRLHAGLSRRTLILRSVRLECTRMSNFTQWMTEKKLDECSAFRHEPYRFKWQSPLLPVILDASALNKRKPVCENRTRRFEPGLPHSTVLSVGTDGVGYPQLAAEVGSCWSWPLGNHDSSVIPSSEDARRRQVWHLRRAARSCPGRMTHQRGPHNPSDGNPLYRKAFNCNYTFGTGTDEWFITCTEFKESKYRFQRTSTWQKTRITRQLSIMKTPPRLIGWLRSTMERAIMHQARSTRRSPSITLVRHTKPRRRLTKNLNIRSSLQLELNLPVVIQDLATGSSPSGHGRAPTALETRGAFSAVAVFFLPAIEQKSYGYAGGIPLPNALFTRQLLPYGRQELHLPAGCRRLDHNALVPSEQSPLGGEPRMALQGGTIVRVKAQDAEGKLMQHGFQHGKQMPLADPRGATDDLPLRDRIHGVDVIDRFGALPIALVDRIIASVSALIQNT